MTIITEETRARVVRLDAGAFSEAKAILYRAYKHEPTFKYLFEYERPGYDQRVRATIRELLNLHFATGQDVIGLALDNHLIAVAMLGSPVVRLDLARQLNWRMRMMLTAGMDCTWRYINYYKQIHKLLPEAQHHELPLMGVDEKYRNMGYGKQLMQAIDQICRENPRSVGMGLDTGNARYLDFYAKLGYRVIGQVKLGDVVENVLFKSFAGQTEPDAGGLVPDQGQANGLA
jgi:GNAT superfamily N-acetyltransferase